MFVIVGWFLFALPNYFQSKIFNGFVYFSKSAQICGDEHRTETVTDVVACLRSVFGVAEEEGFPLSIVDVGDFASNNTSCDSSMEDVSIG